MPNEVVCNRRMTVRRIIPIEGIDIESTIGYVTRRNVPLSQIGLEFTRLLEQWYRNEISEDLFCDELRKGEEVF